MSERRRIPSADELEQREPRESPIRRFFGGITRFRVRRGIGEARTTLDTMPTVPSLPPPVPPAAATSPVPRPAAVAGPEARSPSGHPAGAATKPRSVPPPRVEGTTASAAPPMALHATPKPRAITIPGHIRAERGATSEPSAASLQRVHVASAPAGQRGGEPRHDGRPPPARQPSAVRSASPTGPLEKRQSPAPPQQPHRIPAVSGGRTRPEAPTKKVRAPSVAEEVTALCGPLPVELSCNRHGDVWVPTSRGHTSPDNRKSVRGSSRCIDDLVAEVLRAQPDGGRFWVQKQGVFLLSSGRWLRRF